MTPVKPFLSALTALALLPAAALAAGPYAVYESDSGFETVMEGAKTAILERGMYINNIMHMGEMLERTGESIEFCSAVLSRKMTLEDPSRIVNCPFILSIYTLPGESDRTYVAHRVISEEEIAGSEIMTEVAEMLKGVAEGATSW
jgi:hypothetical protein